MPTLHPMPARPPRPSQYRDGYCETPYCWNRESVFYDHVARMHRCWRCWAKYPGSQSVVIPQVAALPQFIDIDRYTAATMRRPR